MRFYGTLHELFSQTCQTHHLLDDGVEIRTRALKPEEAIGDTKRKDFPLLKGKEVLMEATFREKKGQAFTDAASDYTGTIGEILDLDLESNRNKALFIAVLNAALRHLHPDLKTIHCKNEDPEECAGEMVGFLGRQEISSVGLIGLQPAILEALVNHVGPGQVTCTDRDSENRGKEKYGTTILWGDEAGLETVFQQSDLVLATGSSSANGSIQEILDAARDHGKPLYFYGTTIAGAARLLDLGHLCFRGS